MEKFFYSLSTILTNFSSADPTTLMFFILALALIWLVSQVAPTKKK